MKPKPFAQPAWIEFEGDRVFRLMNRYPDHAQFELIGFEGQIFINEYRRHSLEALDSIISQQEDIATFASHFNNPAFVQIPNLQNSPLEVTLTETEETWPAYMMLVDIDTERDIPTDKYLINLTIPLEKHKKAIFSLYPWPTHFASLPEPQRQNWRSWAWIKATSQSVERFFKLFTERLAKSLCNLANRFSHLEIKG